MAHNIMENRMFYSFKEQAWHQLGTISCKEETAIEVLDNEFQGGFTTSLRPVVVELNGGAKETGDYAVVRSATSDPESKEVIFGFCTERYQPLQPRQICETFDTNVRQNVETMAFLGDGNDMFISWKMPEIEVVKDDTVQLFGIVRTGFDTLKGTSLFTSTFRPVCQNTINLAQGWAKKNTDGKGKGEIWNSKHVNKNLLRDLGYWMAHVQENAQRESGLVANFFQKLAKTPIKNEAEVHEILYTAYPPMDSLGEYYPKELRKDKEESIFDANKRQEGIRDGIYELFAGSGTGITPDYWGVMNSTSEYFNHIQASKKPIASSVMFGNRQKQIMQVVNVLKERV